MARTVPTAHGIYCILISRSNGPLETVLLLAAQSPLHLPTDLQTQPLRSEKVGHSDGACIEARAAASRDNVHSLATRAASHMYYVRRILVCM